MKGLVPSLPFSSPAFLLSLLLSFKENWKHIKELRLMSPNFGWTGFLRLLVLRCGHRDLSRGKYILICPQTLWIVLVSRVAAARIVMVYFQKGFFFLWTKNNVTKNDALPFWGACPVLSPAFPHNTAGLWVDKYMPLGHPEFPSPLRLMGRAIVRKFLPPLSLLGDGLEARSWGHTALLSHPKYVLFIFLFLVTQVSNLGYRNMNYRQGSWVSGSFSLRLPRPST